MKINTPSPLVALLSLFLASAALTHEPSKHMQDAESPNCSAMEDMDLSKMDRDDPVMQAMMKRCPQHQRHDHTAEDKPHHNHNHNHNHNHKDESNKDHSSHPH